MIDKIVETITRKAGAGAGLILALAALVNSLNDDELNEFLTLLENFMKKVEERRKMRQLETLINSLSEEEKEKLRQLLS